MVINYNHNILKYRPLTSRRQWFRAKIDFNTLQDQLQGASILFMILGDFESCHKQRFWSKNSSGASQDQSQGANILRWFAFNQNCRSLNSLPCLYNVALGSYIQKPQSSRDTISIEISYCFTLSLQNADNSDNMNCYSQKSVWHTRSFYFQFEMCMYKSYQQD